MQNPRSKGSKNRTICEIQEPQDPTTNAVDKIHDPQDTLRKCQCSMQHQSKSWILNPVCPLHPSIGTTEKRYRKLKRSTPSIKNVDFMVEDPSEPIIFSKQNPGSPGSSSNGSQQDPRSTGSRKNCVDKIQDPGTGSFHQIPTQDPGSVETPDPGFRIFLGYWQMSGY